ncbi:MAG: LemA family protein [Actinomycetota bacterium]|nr:LemA family protein [Actinomycetota bacterium]
MVILLIVAVAAAVATVFLVRKRWRFTDTPTSDAAHVFPGLSEVHGTVEAIGQPAAAASDGSPCVWWMYELERKSTDSKGNSKWVTEEQGATAQPFLVRDASGVVRVVIDEDASVSGAESVDVEHLSLNALRPYARVMKSTYTPGNFLGGLFGRNELTEPITEFGGSWRAKEHRLLVGQQVFLTAHARLTPGGDRVELAHTDAKGKRCTFELSVGDERAAIGAYASPWLLALCATASLVCGAIGGNKAIGGAGTVLFPGILLAGAAALWLVGSWNRVRRARERGKFAWSLIDVACEQRSQTIPQLQTVVGAAFAHEQSLFTAVAAARDLGHQPSSAGAQTVQAAQAAMHQVVARIEAHPTLTSQPNVAHLMQQITLLTDRVAFGRRFYNDSVQRLADRLGEFPDSLIARLAGVTPLPLIDDLDPPQLPPPVFPPPPAPPMPVANP